MIVQSTSLKVVSQFYTPLPIMPESMSLHRLMTAGKLLKINVELPDLIILLSCLFVLLQYLGVGVPLSEKN